MTKMPDLQARIVEMIRRQGAITFRDFMYMALYDEHSGYYNTERVKIGAEGDYYTSSNLHPAFSAILAQTFVELRAKLDAETSKGKLTVRSGATSSTDATTAPARARLDEDSQDLAIVEIGAGTGKLAHGILSALCDEHPAIFRETRYYIIETSSIMRGLQQKELAEFADRVEWSEWGAIAQLNRVDVVFSNEWIDALPVHRIRLGTAGLEEQYVTAKAIAGRATSELQPDLASDSRDASAAADCEQDAAKVTDPDIVDRGSYDLELCWQRHTSQNPHATALSEYRDRARLKLRQGQIIEVNLDAIEWLRKLATIIGRGYLITIDYGDVAGLLYTPDRPQGTLRSFYRHRLIDSPLERLGQQDLTASVNFTALMEYGKDVGFETCSYERQSGFLLRQGLIERVVRLQEATGTREDLQDRIAVKNLFVPGGASENFRVLIQRKR